MRTVARALAVRKYFTAEEFFQLLCYEFFQFFKKNFIYIFIAFVWSGVLALTLSMILLPYEAEVFYVEEPQTIVAEPKKIVEPVKPDYSKIVDEIDKNKNKDALLSSEDICIKVLLYSNEFGINPVLIFSIIEKESNFKETAVAKDYNKTKSLGWSQASKSAWDTFNAQYVWPIYKTTWAEKDKYDPDKSLVFICWYVNWLKKHYPEKTQTPYDIYKCYNGGVNGVHKAEVKRNADAFQKIYDRYFIAMGGSL